jgi:hypothetical protein
MSLLELKLTSLNMRFFMVLSKAFYKKEEEIY